MNEAMHQKVQLAYTLQTLPARILERFEPGWTAIQACEAVGFVDDDSDGKLFVLYEDGPGPRSAIQVDPGEVKLLDPLGVAAVVADPTGAGEGGIPPLESVVPGRMAGQITKVYLVDRKEPILVHGELEQIRNAIWHEVGGAPAPSRWVQFQRVDKEATVTPDDIVINPAFVVSLQSERA